MNMKYPNLSVAVEESDGLAVLGVFIKVKPIIDITREPVPVDELLCDGYERRTLIACVE